VISPLACPNRALRVSSGTPAPRSLRPKVWRKLCTPFRMPFSVGSPAALHARFHPLLLNLATGFPRNVKT
jgi:hypothetical protein